MSPITEAVSLRTAVIWHLCQAQSEQHGYGLRGAEVGRELVT